MFDLCHGNALCVLVSGSYGVVCIVSGVVKCVTCRFGARTCEHVKHVMKLVDSDDALAPLLQKFAKALTMTCPTKVKSSPTCLSLTRIPVNFTETQRQVMKQPNTIRLRVEDGISYLLPDDLATCTQCAATNWSAPVFVRQCIVVTEEELINANGLFLVCACMCVCVCVCVCVCGWVGGYGCGACVTSLNVV